MISIRRRVLSTKNVGTGVEVEFRFSIIDFLKTMVEQTRYLNTSLSKALKILSLFNDERRELSLSEVARLLETQPGAVYPILYTLQVHGYLTRDPETKRFRLGLKILTQANYLLSSLDIREQAKPILRGMARELSVNAHLAVLHENEVLYLDREEAAPGVVLTSIVGRRVPLHCTALGKVLLAFNPEMEGHVLDGDTLKAVTSKTITNPKALRAEIARVRNQGYAVDNEEFHEGNVCVAAPIRNYRSTVVAAISISFAKTRLGYEHLEELVSKVVNGSIEISQALGWRHD